MSNTTYFLLGFGIAFLAQFLVLIISSERENEVTENMLLDELYRNFYLLSNIRFFNKSTFDRATYLNYINDLCKRMKLNVFSNNTRYTYKLNRSLYSGIVYTYHDLEMLVSDSDHYVRERERLIHPDTFRADREIFELNLHIHLKSVYTVYYKLEETLKNFYNKGKIDLVSTEYYSNIYNDIIRLHDSVVTAEKLLDEYLCDDNQMELAMFDNLYAAEL